MERLVGVLGLWLLGMGATCVWTLAQVAVATALGARPCDVRVGSGPRMLAWRMGGMAWSFRPLMLNGSVGFKEEGVEEPDGLDRVRRLPAARYLVAVLAPWAVMVLVAMLCLGASEGLRHFASGFTLLFEFSALPDRLRRLFLLVREGEWARAWGLLCAKMAAFNLLPLPLLAGGNVLFSPWRQRNPDWRGRANAVGLVVLLGFYLYVLYVLAGILFF